MEMKIALFGGTFNPPHKGHLAVVKNLTNWFDEVWVLVARMPNKTEKPFVAASHRLAMAKLAFDGVQRVTISDLEFKRTGMTYTADTMEMLALRYPSIKFTWVMGADLLTDFSRWKRAKWMAENIDFLIVHRPGFRAEPELVKGFQNAKIIDIQKSVEASSFQIRHWLNNGLTEKAHAKMPDIVADYIRTHGLYGH
jgi:nicotinate-nucleotide adenylyltransferase